MCGSYRSGGKFNYLRIFALALAASAALGIARPRSASAGGNYYTTDYFGVTTYHDTDLTKDLTNYSVTINAFINGTQSVYSETFADPYSDAVVQAGVAAAMVDLSKASATNITGPTLESNSTTLKSSTTKTVVTGTQKVVNPNLGDSPVTIHAGPTTAHLFTGDGDSHTTIVGHSFLLLAGKQDIDVMAPIETVVDRTITTTDTFVTDQVYNLFGTVTTNQTPGGNGGGNGGNGGGNNPVINTDPTDPTNPGGNNPPNDPPPPNDPVNPVVPPAVTAIPLPAAFWPAISMLGVLGLIQLARLRRSRAI
jgi:hypothetical protein